MESSQVRQAALELSVLSLNNITCNATIPGPPVGLLQDEIPFDNCKAKSQNITNYVTVPSSEHVAEIVGRQGCKIKALRAKTNTYIQTPLRGDSPTFNITGRPEDVAAAKRDIEYAAEHFTQIRTRNNNNSEGFRKGQEDSNRVTILVRVPYQVVGLVVGPKGATIKHIQQITSTYILTPPRDKEPVFQVRGTPANAAKAKIEIESYMIRKDVKAMPYPSPDISHQCALDGQKMSSRYSMLDCATAETTKNNQYLISDKHNMAVSEKPALSFHSSPPKNFSDRDRSSEASSPMYSSDSNSSLDSLESDLSMCFSPKRDHRGLQSTPCWGCHKREVVAALVPCGHNYFCMQCAKFYAEYACKCPVCEAPVKAVLRIHN